jgi:hypothetical protein
MMFLPQRHLIEKLALTKKPTLERGRGGGEARRGSRSPSLPLPPIPTFPRQGGRGNT